MMKPIRILVTVFFLFSLSTTVALADSPSFASNVAIDTVWVLLAAFLVFLMQAGFGLLEAGLTRAKNAINILMKNFMDFCTACVFFFAVGYAIMFGEGNPIIGTHGFFLFGADNPSGVPLEAFYLFQAVFCGAAATIVAGAMAERMKFGAYLMYTVFISALIYPIVGHWIWGGGWLSALGFGDFAGSTVVHATGGFIGLAGTMLLGPRIGKFRNGGPPNVLPGHNIPIAALGVFLLWFGWFGFNPGSSLSVGNGKLISIIAMNTNLAACAGALAAMSTVWIRFGKPDISMTMNGALAGLVAVTAPCAFVSPIAALTIGALGGVLVVFGVSLLDRLGIDDPVGAVPVHGMNGLWGTISVGLFGQKELGLARDGLFHGGGFAQLGVQILGGLCVSLFVFGSMWLVFYAIKKTYGLRVDKQDELRGLDIGEHGMESYAGFQIYITE